MNATLRLARPPTLTQMAVDQLRDAIVSGRFLPGQRLVELELSENLGVSRAPLREAFRILAGEGLIEIKQNRGCTVVNPSVEELEQMVLFRAHIEGAAARLVTARGDASVFDRLAGYHQTLIGARKIEDNLPFREAYWEFHRHLVTLSGNGFLLQSWNQIGAMHRIFMSRTAPHFQDRREIVSTIGGFLKCFRSGDAAMAESVVRGMITWMGYILLDVLIPGDVASFVTHLIGPNGEVVAMTPAMIAKRKRPAAPPSATKPRTKIGRRSAVA